jgi:DNA-binding GntR family transcriptional regulator
MACFGARIGNCAATIVAVALHKRLTPFRRLQLRVRNRLITSQREHEEIVAAIRDGHTELAADRLRAHVVIQGERFSDLVASIERVAVPA